MTIRIGAVWILLNLAAAVFLGAEFIVQEIRNLITRPPEHEAGQPVNAIPSLGPRA